MPRIENVLYENLDWKPKPYSEGITVTLVNADGHHVASLEIVPIDDSEQAIIDEYDARRYQKPEDTVVFYAEWDDGEWQPRSTHPTIDEAKKAADSWWLGYTQKISEEKAAQDG